MIDIARHASEKRRLEPNPSEVRSVKNRLARQPLDLSKVPEPRGRFSLDGMRPQGYGLRRDALSQG
jgi:hypothetical protein